MLTDYWRIGHELLAVFYFSDRLPMFATTHVLFLAEYTQPDGTFAAGVETEVV
jgi:hypothetical protein